MERPDYTLANCNREDVNIFFPEAHDRAGFQLARDICRQCVIREECLEDNLTAKDGFVGGTSARERRLLRASRSHLRLVVE